MDDQELVQVRIGAYQWDTYDSNHVILWAGGKSDATVAWCVDGFVGLWVW